jgi:hypothetical protein
LPRSGHNLSVSWLENLPLPAAPLLGRFLLVAQSKDPRPKSSIGQTRPGEAKPRSPSITLEKAKPTETEK